MYFLLLDTICARVTFFIDRDDLHMENEIIEDSILIMVYNQFGINRSLIPWFLSNIEFVIICSISDFLSISGALSS